MARKLLSDYAWTIKRPGEKQTLEGGRANCLAKCQSVADIPYRKPNWQVNEDAVCAGRDGWGPGRDNNPQPRTSSEIASENTRKAWVSSFDCTISTVITIHQPWPRQQEALLLFLLLLLVSYWPRWQEAELFLLPYQLWGALWKELLALL